MIEKETEGVLGEQSTIFGFRVRTELLMWCHDREGCRDGMRSAGDRAEIMQAKAILK
jgi:hypothetical protein